MRITKKSRLLVTAIAVAALSLGVTPAQAVDLQGSGASFVGNIVDACKTGFAKKSNHSVTYSPLGSSTGVRNADGSIGDFWFSDAAHLASTRRSSVINVPLVAAPIAVLHNLPARTQLYLSPETLAEIFAGQLRSGTIQRSWPTIIARSRKWSTRRIPKETYSRTKMART